MTKLAPELQGNNVEYKNLVVKEKMASNDLGIPKFTYHVPSTATKQ
ncbi:MAG: hypothetical protein ABSB40_06240 [Nitrososphaeria archaeon]